VTVTGQLALLMAFPAPAGMNRESITSSLMWLCVPRTRGDEPNYAIGGAVNWMAFPAPAGMNHHLTPH